VITILNAVTKHNIYRWGCMPVNKKRGEREEFESTYTKTCLKSWIKPN